MQLINIKTFNKIAKIFAYKYYPRKTIIIFILFLQNYYKTFTSKKHLKILKVKLYYRHPSMDNLKTAEILFTSQKYHKAFAKLNTCSSEDVIMFFKTHKELNNITKKQNFKHLALKKFWHSQIPITHFHSLFQNDLISFLILSFLGNPEYFSLKVLYLIFQYHVFESMQYYKLCQSYKFPCFYYGLMLIKIKKNFFFSYKPKYSFKKEIKWIKKLSQEKNKNIQELIELYRYQMAFFEKKMCLKKNFLYFVYEKNMEKSQFYYNQKELENYLIEHHISLNLSPVEQAHHIEKSLCKDLENNGYQTISNLKYNYQNIKGEIDVLAYKDEILFIYEIKTTKFSQDIKHNALFYYRQIDIKADEQLRRACNFLKTNEGYQILKQYFHITTSHTILQKHFYSIIITNTLNFTYINLNYNYTVMCLTNAVKETDFIFSKCKTHQELTLTNVRKIATLMKEWWKIDNPKFSERFNTKIINNLNTLGKKIK